MAIALDKWFVMISIFVVSLLLGLVPYFLLKKVKSWTNIMTNTNYHLMLTILSCLGGGVLLATGTMHMLPENREALENIESVWELVDEHFPAAEVLMLIGFALIYMIEEFAHFILSEGSEHDGHGHLHHHHILARHNSIAHGIPVPIPGGSRPSLLSIGSLKAFAEVTEEDGGRCGSICSANIPISVKVTSAETDKKNKNRLLEVPDRKIEAYGDNEIIVYDDGGEKGDSTLASKLRSLLAVLALSFHAIMEGIAIGIENSSNVWFMFGAIASHKFVISFCMGMELCASKARLSTLLISVFLFAILSPIGIFIGSYITDVGAPNTLPISIIQGLATGTILYVIFFEILNRERERKTGVLKKVRSTGFIQFLSVTAGLILMACLLTLVGHEHGHSHDHDDDHHHDDECHDQFSSTTEHDHDHDDHDHFLASIS